MRAASTPAPCAGLTLAQTTVSKTVAGHPTRRSRREFSHWKRPPLQSRSAGKHTGEHADSATARTAMTLDGVFRARCTHMSATLFRVPGHESQRVREADPRRRIAVALTERVAGRRGRPRGLSRICSTRRRSRALHRRTRDRTEPKQRASRNRRQTDEFAAQPGVASKFRLEAHPVRVRVAGVEYNTLSDAEGYFRIQVKDTGALTAGWNRITATSEGATTDGALLLMPAANVHGLISDLDENARCMSCDCLADSGLRRRESRTWRRRRLRAHSRRREQQRGVGHARPHVRRAALQPARDDQSSQT